MVHDYHGLNIKSFEHLYLESRSLTLSNIRFFSDSRVRHALDVKEEREAGWRRKFSPAIYAKGLIQDLVPPVAMDEEVSTVGNGLDSSNDSWSSLELDGPPLPPPPPVVPSLPPPSVSPLPVSPAPAPPMSVSPSLPASATQARDAMKRQLKGKVQSRVREEFNDFWKEKIGRYVMQGDFLALVKEEQDSITWRSFLWDVPQGVLKFAVNAGINTLPSLDNLKRWGKRTNDRCPFCGNIETLLHILSNCSTSLDQGRYTWRHDSVLTSIITLIRPHLYDGMVLYSDMIGYQAPHGGTIPPHILVTNLRPDIFIVDENARIAIVFELTCPWDNNIERSHTYKEEKYSPLVADLANSFSVFHFSVEVSVRGQVTKNNRARLKSFVYRSCRDARPLTKSLTKIISKAALLSSFSLFNARKEPSWISPTPLVVK